MALPLANTFDGGTSGTAISNANSGGTSGDAFDTTTGTVPTFDNTHSHSGSLSCLITAVGGVEWTTSVGTVQDLYGRIYIYATAVGSSTIAIARILTPTSTTTGQFLLRISGTTMKLTNQVKGATAVASTNALTLNSWNRIEYHAHNVGGVGTMTLDCSLYLGANADGTTADEVMGTASGTGVSTDTSINGVIFGTANTPGTSLWIDDLQANSTGFPGPSGGGGTTTLRELMMLGVGV